MQPRNDKGGMADVGPESSDKEVLKNSPFSKGQQWPVETYINVGYGGVCEVIGTPASAGLQSVISKNLLALAYASGQHEGLLAVDPESFLQRWGEHDRRARSAADRGRSGGDERLQCGDGDGHDGGRAPRYQGAPRTWQQRAECLV